MQINYTEVEYFSLKPGKIKEMVVMVLSNHGK